MYVIHQFVHIYYNKILRDKTLLIISIPCRFYQKVKQFYNII